MAIAVYQVNRAPTRQSCENRCSGSSCALLPGMSFHSRIGWCQSLACIQPGRFRCVRSLNSALVIPPSAEHTLSMRPRSASVSRRIAEVVRPDGSRLCRGAVRKRLRDNRSTAPPQKSSGKRRTRTERSAERIEASFWSFIVVTVPVRSGYRSRVDDCLCHVQLPPLAIASGSLYSSMAEKQLTSE